MADKLKFHTILSYEEDGKIIESESITPLSSNPTLRRILEEVPQTMDMVNEIIETDKKVKK